MGSECCGTRRGIRGKEDRMRRIVDLTLPIEEHWRYGIKFEEIMSFAKGDPWQVTSYNLESHWFTHIDAPLHFVDGGRSLSDYPIADWCMTDCLVLDLSYVGDNDGITAEMLQRAAEGHRDKHYDSLLIRSDRGRKVSWKDAAYWDNSCYLTEDAAIWIKEYKPKLVGYDFAQDYEIRLIKNRKPGQVIHQPVHDHVLVAGEILQVEYMTNPWEIGSPTCTLVCLPLPTQNANGSQVRVIAVVEE